MFFRKTLKPRHFTKGDLVEIRSAAEIRATLDAQGNFENLPFMPEMVRFCGGRYRVLVRLDKIYLDGHRFVGQLTNTVTLEDVRCDGSAHGGCQVGCLTLWKEAWLKPAVGATAPSPAALLPLIQPAAACGDAFSCQATELVRAVKRISPWALWRYTREYAWRERSLPELARMVFLMVSNKIRRWRRKPLHGSTPGPLEKTPAVVQDLRPGDLVRVKDREEIRGTLDGRGRNRGLVFTPDMVRFCGQTFRVARRVERAVMDFSGQMREFNHTVALENVHCSGLSLGACGRRCYHLWREAWLEKIESAATSAGDGGNVVPDATEPTSCPS